MIPFAYNGYATNFTYDLQDTFSVTRSDVETATHVYAAAGSGDLAADSDLVYDKYTGEIREPGESAWWDT